MKKFLYLILAIALIVISGCTKVVYVEPDICPQKCVTSFSEKHGSCRESLESLARGGGFVDFEPEKFECDNSYEIGDKCSCYCNCGLGYKFEI